MSTISFDTREFQRALELYKRDSKRDFADICNRAAFDIARWAIQETPKASTSKIESAKNSPHWPKYIAKRMKKGVSFTFKSKARGSRRVRFDGAYRRSEAKSVSTKIIQARKRARSFLAAGWIRPVQIFAAKIFGTAAKTRAPGAKQYGQAKGTGTPARRETWSPFAIIQNSALNATKFSSRPNAMPVAMKGLKRAFARKTADYERVAMQRLQRTARKYSAK